MAAVAARDQDGEQGYYSSDYLSAFTTGDVASGIGGDLVRVAQRVGNGVHGE